MKSLIRMHYIQQDIKQHSIYKEGIRSVPQLSNEYGIERNIFRFLGKTDPTIRTSTRTKKKGGKKSRKYRK